MEFFSFSEFERSESAGRWGIDNRMPVGVKRNVEALVDRVLDPLRRAWGRPIQVTSGYRCEELNGRVGGVATSQHLTGQAADITTGNRVDNARLFQLAIDLGLPFDQLIWEKGDKSGPGWIHVSYRVNPRGQVLRL